MTPIYLSAPNGRQATYSEDQIRDMWSQGILANGTLYWKEGMPEWKPLQEYLGAAVTPVKPPPIPPPRKNHYAFTRDPGQLTAFLQWMLWASFACAVITLFSDLAQLNLLKSGSISPAESTSNDDRQAAIGLISFLVFLVTAVTFLKWIHRANTNSRGFGATGMTFTPGWSVGWYFVPGMNLFRPYQAMKEIWQISQDPRRWNDKSASALLRIWWVLWLIYAFLGQLEFRLSLKAQSMQALEVATVASIVSSIIEATLCLTALYLITTIHDRQRALVAHSSGRPLAVPSSEVPAKFDRSLPDPGQADSSVRDAGISGRSQVENDLLAAGTSTQAPFQPTSPKAALVPQFGSPWTVPDLGIHLMWVVPGRFTMGSPLHESERADDEGPQTQIILTKGFWLGRSPVTQGEWRTLMGSTPSHFQHVGLDAPVENVSWEHAVLFCRVLTDKEQSAGRLPPGFAYTLPSEAQWEFACRAGAVGPYGASGDLDSIGWYIRNSGGTTRPTCAKQANAWNLHDMHGNIWEWTSSWYGDYPGGELADYSGCSSGEARVVRGGCWNESASGCRSATRFKYAPDRRDNDLGFRVALNAIR